jgi:hypothetical protein
MAMSTNKVPVILAFAVALFFETQALALNPQPEPPMPYHGYEYVISSLGDNGWGWEIRKRVDGNRPQILSRGFLRGDHARAVSAARGSIDHLAAPRPSLATPH